jgi:hypothetical protein
MSEDRALEQLGPWLADSANPAAIPRKRPRAVSR